MSARHCATRLLNTTTAQSCKYNIRVCLFFPVNENNVYVIFVTGQSRCSFKAHTNLLLFTTKLWLPTSLVKYYFQNKWDFLLRASPSERVKTHRFHIGGRLNFWTESVTLTFPIYKTKLHRQIQSQTRWS